MIGEVVRQRMVLLVIAVALIGFYGCGGQKGQMRPAAEEIETGGGEQGVGQAEPRVRGGEEEGLSEESLRGQARQELQNQLEDIYFEFDKYNITPEARLVLKKDYQLLESVPDAGVVVEGHCDERGTVEYNLALGQRRANAARDYLISLGLDPARLSTVSYGEERPLDPGHTEDAWAKNRRCHLVILQK